MSGTTSSRKGTSRPADSYRRSRFSKPLSGVRTVTALILSYPIKLTLRVLDPAAWFVNLFVGPLLWMLRVRTGESADAPKLSTEEIRTRAARGYRWRPIG